MILPCVTILPMAWADKIIVESNDDLYDDDPIVDENIDIHASYDDPYDIWVENTLGKDENSSAIVPIKTDLLYDSALDEDPIIFDDPPCETMVTSLYEDTNECGRDHRRGVVRYFSCLVFKTSD